MNNEANGGKAVPWVRSFAIVFHDILSIQTLVFEAYSSGCIQYEEVSKKVKSCDKKWFLEKSSEEREGSGGMEKAFPGRESLSRRLDKRYSNRNPELNPYS